MGSVDDCYWTSDTLFTTINNLSFPFPDPREIGTNKYIYKQKNYTLCNLSFYLKFNLFNY